MKMIFLVVILFSSFCRAESRFTPNECFENLKERDKNPWLKVTQSKARRQGDPDKVNVEGYVIRPANIEKQFEFSRSRLKEDEPVTKLSKIDCQNGTAFLSACSTDPDIACKTQVIDLYTGQSHKVIDGWFGWDPKGDRLLVMEVLPPPAEKTDESCRVLDGCDLKIEMFDCPQRKTAFSACQSLARRTYQLFGADGAVEKLNKGIIEWIIEDKTYKFTLSKALECELIKDKEIRCRVSPKAPVRFRTRDD